MAHLHPAPFPSSKQRTERPNGQGASVLKSASEGTHKTRNRAFGTGVHPRIAVAEALVEAIVALKDCAQLERRVGKALSYNERTRKTLEAQFGRSEISYETYSRHIYQIDKIDLRLARLLNDHGTRIERTAIPEVQQGYAHAEVA